MASAAPPTRFAGIVCPKCQYDLRGLSQPICPECGTRFDPDARLGSTRRAVVGWTASAIAVCSAAYVVWSSVDLGSTYFREIGGWCATVRAWVRTEIRTTVPMMLVAPVLACAVSWWAGRGFVLARLAALVAVLGWFASYIYIRQVG